MKRPLIGILFLTVFISCENYKNHIAESSVILTRSATEYSNAINAGSSNPFTMKEFHIDGDSAFIAVSYSGGCRDHSFKVIWGESFIKTYPPQVELFVVHESNGDECKQMMTETLSFNLRNLIGSADYEKIVVNVLNPASNSLSDIWYPSDINIYNVVFPEGAQCQVEVKAGTVICGAGLWDNLWLALNDSITAGVEGTYFKKWLQPVMLSDELKGFKPVPGKKYLVGATIQRDHPYLNVPVCLAFSGPSVPVKLNCVTELN